MAAAAAVWQIGNPRTRNGQVAEGRLAVVSAIERLGATALRLPAWGQRERTLDQDAILVERCLGGEDAAWEELIRTHTRRVYAICYRFTGTEGEAQDITQEVFLRVFQNLNSFRSGEGSFTVWLSRLTRNLLIDNYRRGKMQRASDSLEDKLAVIEETSPGYSKTDSQLNARETSELIQAGLQKLSPELREAVVLRDLEEMEYKDIAEVLKVPEGTVKSRINRGRAELARVLRKWKVAI
ncbi:MAG: sigma-70 family RNA polymerase sigma factor [Acidobacteria bacterium]|nr:sigma-70 family RNA polymerase sigma factor [Acidobacteriota bacterium]